MSKDEIATLKKKAQHLLRKDKVKEALAIYEKLVERSPGDIATRQKLGDLQQRLGDLKQAVATYQHVASAYAGEGHLLKAIAICKVILQLDNTHQETLDVLTELYAKRRGKSGDSVGKTGKHVSAAMAVAILSHKNAQRKAEQGPRPPSTNRRPTNTKSPAHRSPSQEIETVGKVTLKKVASDPIAQADPALNQTAVAHAYVPVPPAKVQTPTAIAPDDLSPVPLFNDLDKSAFITLAKRMDFKKEPAGTSIITEGERGDALYILVQGRVAVHRKVDGKDVALALLSDGAFFGEMALVSTAPRTASVTAVEDVSFFRVSRSLLREIVKEHPGVKHALHRFHRQRLLENLTRTSRVFGALNDEDRVKVMGQFKSGKVAQGKVVIKAGRPGAGLFLIQSGEMQAFSVTDGGEVLLGTLHAGDVFGEMSSLSGEKTSASVRCTSECVLLRLSGAALKTLIESSPQVATELQQLSAARQQSNARRLTPIPKREVHPQAELDAVLDDVMDALLDDAFLL